jgi:hypothetical protein
MKVATKEPGAIALADIDVAPRVVPRWGRSAVWQLGDYARGIGPATLVTASVAIALMAWTFSAARFATAPSMRQGVGELLLQLGLFGSIFAVTGLIATDRTRGFYRFMFAKPVSPLRYYAQAFALRGLGLLGITAIAWVLCAVAVIPISLPAILAANAMQFALVGSVTLLLSTLVRFEWLAMLVLTAMAWIAMGGSLAPHPAWWVLLLHWILPPVGQASNLGRMLLGLVPHWAQNVAGVATWVVGYAAGAFGAAMALLKRREWAR